MTHPSSRVVWGLALAVCMTASAGGARAGAAPAAGPASAPSTTRGSALDQSTPKSLLRSFYASRGEVDEATLRSLLHAASPPEQKVLDAVVQVELANARLRAARRL